jgi:hypothetical protein
MKKRRWIFSCAMLPLFWKWEDNFEGADISSKRLFAKQTNPSASQCVSTLLFQNVAV